MPSWLGRTRTFNTFHFWRWGRLQKSLQSLVKLKWLQGNLLGMFQFLLCWFSHILYNGFLMRVVGLEPTVVPSQGATALEAVVYASSTTPALVSLWGGCEG